MNPLAPALIPTPNPDWPGFRDAPAEQTSIIRADLASGAKYSFNRRWLVTLASLSPRAYNSLRTTFEVERNTFSAANKGKISLYNMSDASRSLILPQSTRIILSVGYGLFSTAPLFPIYDGYFYSATTKRSGPDFITDFELTEYGPQIGTTIANLSFPQGTTNTAIVTALIGLMPGIIPGPQIGLQPFTYSRSVVITGSVKDNLDKLLKQQGLDWHVLGGVLYIHPKNVSPIAKVPIISEATGLLGSPNLTTPQGGAQTVTFECLINPNVFPGVQVSLYSRLISTPLILRSVKYSGDTHTSRWTQTCEGTPIGVISGELSGPPGP